MQIANYCTNILADSTNSLFFFYFRVLILEYLETAAGSLADNQKLQLYYYKNVETIIHEYFCLTHPLNMAHKFSDYKNNYRQWLRQGRSSSQIDCFLGLDTRLNTVSVWHV